MTLPRWPSHDPGDIIDYNIDWSQWLQAGEIITNSTWAIPPDMIMEFSAIQPNGMMTTIWLTGGTYGETALVQNTVATSLSRTEVRSILLPIIPN